MRRSKQKLCLGCSQPFSGRADAKTCSPKCRKRLERSRVLYRSQLLGSEHQNFYKRSQYGLTDGRRQRYE